MFVEEARVGALLNHPNIVQVFDFGASDGLVYLAMEYLKGEDLGHLIRRTGPLSVERTLKIVIQVCSSLGEAHAMGMVHRDLKPENIIVMQGEEQEDLIKVLDFGLAKLRESGELAEVTSPRRPISRRALATLAPSAILRAFLRAEMASASRSS